MSKLPRNHVETGADVFQTIGSGGAFSGSNQVIRNGEVILAQFFATGLGSAIGGFFQRDNHTVFLNSTITSNSEIKFPIAVGGSS